MSDDGELNVSGVYMPKFFAEPVILSSKKDRDRKQLRYVPPAPRPHHSLRSGSSQPRTRLIHSRMITDPKADFDSSFHQMMQNGKLKGGECNEPIFKDIFQIQSRIGFGSFGDVYHCINKSTGREYAVKKSRRTYTGDFDRSRQLLEVQRICRIPPHNHLVAFENAWEEEGHLFLQMELCSKSLNQYIEEGHQLDETIVWDVLVDMLQALYHLHKHHLIHMDIKTDNILLSKEPPTLYKLADFGIAVSLEETQLHPTEYTEGDSRYLAPEVIHGRVSTKADVFSLGIVIVEIACHVDLPNSGDLWHKLRTGILPPPCDELLPDSLREVVSLMLESDVERRPEVATLLALPSVIKRVKRRKWSMFFSYLDSKVRALKRVWNAIICFLASLIVIGRRRRGPVPNPPQRQRCSSTPDRIVVMPPELQVNDSSFSDDDDIRPAKTSTPVFASTPISATKTNPRSSARFRTGRFNRISREEEADPLTPASRNLLREFDAVSD